MRIARPWLVLMVMIIEPDDNGLDGLRESQLGLEREAGTPTARFHYE